MVLHRLYSDDYCTIGVLSAEHGPLCVTLEDPWRENMKNISCIPTGFYRCERVTSPRFGDTFEVTGVPNRTHILFHWGNKPDDTEGCILVARQFGEFDNKPGIVASRDGFADFLEHLRGRDRFPLHVLNVSKVV